MIEQTSVDPGNQDGGPLTAHDIAAYILELSRELAALAGDHGLNKLAAALELAQTLAGEAVAEFPRQARSGNAAPEDAA